MADSIPKTIGVLGGMSWESTQVYYQQLNQLINQQLGGLHSARMVLINVDFAPIEALMASGNWSAIGDHLAKLSQQIEQAGAEFLLIATNTMHKLADQIQRSIDIPVLHIADAVAAELHLQGHDHVGLLGTAFTMEQDFYSGHLKQHHHIEVITPVQTDRDRVHEIIFNELCHGQLLDTSRADYLRIIDSLQHEGAQAIILGCTEIGLLVQQQHTQVPLIDASKAHIDAAVKLALKTA
ncbi:aspartate/glutamate racemase family protein [Marinicella sediminis]|uniref:Aspartate/glutamate racemase family protein n=1 Tax=Marinicella sediminis TaxID=1792834 RepID=A0ABV7JDR1_9GAMM|nr:amino acid racemase [Marinicella sediminis]